MINTQKLFSHFIKSFAAICSCVFLYFVFASTAYAATVELSVNGGSNAAITNGETVTLEWFIDGAVSSCVINNGVGPIDTSSLPTTGSLEVTPPEGATTDYTLTCTGGSSTATVAINPEVTLTTDSFWTTGKRDFNSGEAKVVLEWTSRYATECSRVWLEEAANPGVIIWSTSYGDEYQTAGGMEFDGDNSQYPITRDTTFYIACSNTVTGASSVDSVFVAVTDPDPLPPPTANFRSEEPGGATTVTRDPVTGLAEVELYWNSNSETDQCAFQAYYLDGTPYPLEEPQGFDRWGAVTSQYAGTFYIDFYETTRFEVTCTNFAYSLGGVDYPEESATADITIIVDPAPPIDRSGIPDVTVAITPLSNYVEEIPGVGYGQIPVQFFAENAEECEFSAGGDNTRADGWWGLSDDTFDATTIINLNVGTTTLYATCSRPYDTTYYSPGDPEYESGTESTSVDVVILPTTASAPQAEVYIYGNANYQNASNIWDNSTVETGFCRNSGSASIDASLRSPNCSGGNVTDVTSSATVTFPFVSRSQQTDTYDLTVKYCDENDGFNDFTISTESGFTTTWRSDAVGQYDSWCSSSNEVTRLIGTDITLEDGELITVECNNSADTLKDEQCIFMGFGVGQENGGSLTYDVSSSTGFAEVPVYWASEYAEHCYDAEAVLTDGTRYKFVTGSTYRDQFVTVDLATTTSLEVSCENVESVETTSSIDIIINDTSASVISATTSIDVFECYDPTLPGVRDTETWEWANPDNSNFCEPAVDLNALAPSISFADAIPDNVSGLYDSIEALIAIENLGPGPLLSGNEIEFLSNIEFDLAIRSEFGVNYYQSPSTPGYTDGLAQPPDVDNPTVTPVLTRTFNGIPFGEHELCAYINLDASDNLIFTEWNSDVTNNRICTDVVLPVPPPPMTITANQSVVRSQQTVDVSWDVHTSYPMNCEAIGPGGINTSFDASANDPNPSSFIQTTAPLTSTSKYQLTCEEPITGTVFVEELTVEVLPESEES